MGWFFVGWPSDCHVQHLHVAFSAGSHGHSSSQGLLLVGVDSFHHNGGACDWRLQLLRQEPCTWSWLVHGFNHLMIYWCGKVLSKTTVNRFNTLSIHKHCQYGALLYVCIIDNVTTSISIRGSHLRWCCEPGSWKSRSKTIWRPFQWHGPEGCTNRFQIISHRTCLSFMRINVVHCGTLMYTILPQLVLWMNMFLHRGDGVTWSRYPSPGFCLLCIERMSVESGLLQYWNYLPVRNRKSLKNPGKRKIWSQNALKSSSIYWNIIN